MRRTLPIVQIILGVAGLGLCLMFFIRYRGPIESAFAQLDSMAADTQVELEMSLDFLNGSLTIVQDLESAAAAHRRTLTHSEDISTAMYDNLHDWQLQLQDFSSMATNASTICGNVASQLPIRIPNVAYHLEQIDLDIPTIQLR